MTASAFPALPVTGGIDARRDALRAAVNVGVWYCDLPFDELTWDSKVKEHFWLPADARVTIETFYDRLHPDDRERTRQAIATSITSQAPYDIEYRTVAPSDHPEAGQVRWLRAIGYTGYGADDQPIRFDGVTVDITAARNTTTALAEAEAALRVAAREEAEVAATLQRIGTMLTAEVDLQRIVQTVTDESTSLTGAQFGAFFYNVVNDGGEEYTLYTLSGVPREAFSGFPMPRNTAVFAPTFHGEGVVRSDDITKDPRYGKNAPYFGKPKGHLPVVSYLAVPVRSRSGKVIGGLFFGHEKPGVFTQRDEELAVGIAGWAAVAMDNARLFESQRHAVAQAEEANRAKSDFLAKMSHDLRTPLNAIGGYTELLTLAIHGPVNDEQVAALGRIKRAQQHLLTLINDILSFAKLEAGQVQIAPTELEVRSVVEELGGLLAPQAQASGLSLRVDAGPPGLTVRADRARLIQILLNLASNAFKFTEKGSIELCALAKDDTIQFQVTDTGCGIVAERVGSIFDPFVQARRGPDEEKGGVGLGLAISRELARLMDGSLSVVSEEGRGSVFTLELPRG
jgi:signal transduction histidine kinase